MMNEEKFQKKRFLQTKKSSDALELIFQINDAVIAIHEIARQMERSQSVGARLRSAHVRLIADALATTGKSLKSH